jgi:integrase
MVTPKFALEQRNVWMREIREGKYVKKVPRTDQVLLETIADRYLEHAKNYHRFWDSTASRIALMKSKEWWKGRTAASITSDEIDAKLLENKAPNGLKWNETTCNEYRGTLFAIYKLAKFGVNPAADAKRYKLNNARKRELLPAEEVRLRAAIKELYPDKEVELDLSLHTGVRFSNLYGTRGSKRKGMDPLQWNAVNLEWKQIQLVRSKAGEGYPVPLNTVALAALEALRERTPKDSNGNSIGAVIRKPSGLALYSSRKWFEACLKKAGIQDFCWHDLRHTFGTRLRRNGVRLEDIAALMGHSLGRLKMTGRYAHVIDDNLREAVRTLEPNFSKNLTRTVSQIRRKKSA